MNRKLNILKCLLLMVMVGALIVPGAVAVSPFDDFLTDNDAGQVSQHEISFVLTQDLPADGTINIGFDPGFNISAFTNDTVVAGIDGTYTWSISPGDPNTIIIRRTSGNSTGVGDLIEFTLGNISNPHTTGSKSVEVATRTGLGTLIELFTTTVHIGAGPVTQFTLGTVSNQVAGTQFTVTVTARDQFGNVNTGFENYTAVLSSTIGAIEPPTMADGDWINGVWTGSEVITKTGTGTITATSGSVTGTSNMFTVAPAVLDYFVIAAIPNQFDEQPFTVTAQAKDGYGNNKTDYNDDPTLTVDVPGAITATVTPDNINFVNGIFSGQVTINVDPNPTLTVPFEGAYLTIGGITDSNEFNISLLPVDLVNSTVVADPTTVIEDGISISTVTVKVKNAINQNVIQGVSVTLESDRPPWYDNIVAINAITDSNGQAKFTISSSVPGKANLTAKVLGTQAINQKPVVTFAFDNKLHLAKGWNLVSVPRILTNSSVTMLNTNKVDKIYYYDAGSGVWKSAFYTSGNWSGTLTTIDDGKGYWINATAPADVPVVLKPLNDDLLQFPPSYSLKAGWNMVGYTSVQLNLFNDISSYFLGVPWITAYEYTGSGFKQAKSNYYGDLEEVTRTKGYWLYLSRDGTLVP